MLRFRFLCYSSPIFLTLGNLAVSFLARGSTLHRGRWTVVKGLLKRRGRRGWNVHLQCLNKKLFLKLPIGKHPSNFCYPRTARPALRNSASLVEGIWYLTSIWNTLKDDRRWSKWNEWIGKLDITHITLHCMSIHICCFTVEDSFKKIFEGIMKNHVQRLVALHFHQYLPYISENEDVVFAHQEPLNIGFTLAVGISVNLLNIPLVGDWLVSHELIRIIVVLVHIYI